MPVNIGTAHLSEHLLLFTIVVYALAMLAYAGDFAFGRQRVTAPEKAARAPELAGVGAVAGTAGRGAASSAGPGGPGGAAGPAGRDAAPVSWWVRAALTLTVAGLITHITGHLAPRHLRGPGPVGQHVRVHHGDHLHGGHRRWSPP